MLASKLALTMSSKISFQSAALASVMVLSDQALSPVDTHCPEENDSTIASDAQPHNANHLHAPSPSTDGGDEPQTPNPNPNHRDDAGASRGPSQMNLQFMSEANTQHQHQHQHPINNIVGASDPSDNNGGNRVSPRRLVTGNVVEE